MQDFNDVEAGTRRLAAAKRLVPMATGLLLGVLTLVAVTGEVGLKASLAPALSALTFSAMAVLALQVGGKGRAFVVVAIVLTLALVLTNADWGAVLARGLASAGFIAAFFVALSTLRSAAETSISIRRSGRYLAQQPPSRRYLALTAGGQMFSLLLNYGSIALLGALAVASANEEPDEEIRRHRTRRMLLAIQRAFVSTLPWSPLSLCLAISTALIPGATWTGALLPGLVISVVIVGVGWALDTVFKPRLSHPAPPRRAPEGSWLALIPLFELLAILFGSVVSLHLLTGVRVVGVVLAIVPIVSLIWVLLQNQGDRRALRRRLASYAFDELPAYRNELVLLMMAGFIGTVGAPLLAPLLSSAGLHPADFPAWTVLVALVWLIPLAGQIGMNPILAVTLVAPLIPEPAALGVAPTALVTAIAAGWALSGASSPFTATTLLIGSFAKVSATHVGVRWNGAYVVICAALLSIWVLLQA